MTKSPVKTSSSFYLPELDIVRFFAFFAVYIHHCFSHSIDSYQGNLAPFSEWIVAILLAGRFALDLFFVLSAFFITRLLMKESDETGSIDAKSFYMRRILRVFPLYYLFVLLAIFVLPYLGFGAPLFFSQSLAFLVFAANWTSAVWGLPDSTAAALWSVSIEEQFYLVFPFIVVLVGIKRLKTIAVIFLIIAFVARILLVLNNASADNFGYNTFVRLDTIALGILMAVLMRSNQMTAIKSLSIRCLVMMVGIGGFICAARFLDWVGIKSLLLFPIVAFSSVLVIWASINYERTDMKKFAVLIYLGRISYGLYVFHLLGIRLAVMAFYQFSLDNKYFVFWRFVIGLVITIILGIISYTFFERYFLQLKKRFTYIKSTPV